MKFTTIHINFIICDKYIQTNAHFYPLPDISIPLCPPLSTFVHFYPFMHISIHFCAVYVRFCLFPVHFFSHFLIFVRNVDLSNIGDVREIVKKWKKRRITNGDFISHWMDSKNERRKYGNIILIR